MRARRAYLLGDASWTDFNPRAPCGRDLGNTGQGKSYLLFQSTRPVRARLGGFAAAGVSDVISIHAPRAGATAKVYKITLHTFATKGNF